MELDEGMEIELFVGRLDTRKFARKVGLVWLWKVGGVGNLRRAFEEYDGVMFAAEQRQNL